MHYKRKYELCYQVASTYSLFLECKNGCDIKKNTYFISIKAHFQELPNQHSIPKKDRNLKLNLKYNFYTQ